MKSEGQNNLQHDVDNNTKNLINNADNNNPTMKKDSDDKDKNEQKKVDKIVGSPINPPNLLNRQFTSFHALIMSFYSTELYKDIAKNWQGIGLSYLFIIITFYSSVETSSYQEKINTFIKNDAPAIIKQIPKITLNNGVAIVDASMPTIIKNPTNKAPLLIIDTTGHTKSPDESAALALLTKTQIIFSKDISSMQPLELKHFEDQTINAKTVSGWLHSFKDWFSVVFFPLFLILTYVFFSIQLVICAFMGGLIAKMIGVDLEFKAIMRITSVAFTPALFLIMVHTSFDILYPMSTAFSLIFTIGYMIFGIGACVEKKRITALSNKP